MLLPRRTKWWAKIPHRNVRIGSHNSCLILSCPQAAQPLLVYPMARIVPKMSRNNAFLFSTVSVNSDCEFHSLSRYCKNLAPAQIATNRSRAWSGFPLENYAAYSMAWNNKMTLSPKRWCWINWTNLGEERIPTFEVGLMDSKFGSVGLELTNVATSVMIFESVQFTLNLLFRLEQGRLVLKSMIDLMGSSYG
jgi:hypothetical protein